MIFFLSTHLLHPTIDVTHEWLSTVARLCPTPALWDTKHTISRYCTEHAVHLPSPRHDLLDRETLLDICGNRQKKIRLTGPDTSDDREGGSKDKEEEEEKIKLVWGRRRRFYGFQVLSNEKEQKQKKKVVQMRDILHDGVSCKENQTGRFHGEWCIFALAVEAAGTSQSTKSWERILRSQGGSNVKKFPRSLGVLEGTKLELMGYICKKTRRGWAALHIELTAIPSAICA